MVSTDLLPESATETRRIYPERKPEPPPRHHEGGETMMMPPPLPLGRGGAGGGMMASSAYELSSGYAATAGDFAKSIPTAESPFITAGAGYDEPVYQPLDPLQLQSSASPPSWLWPDGSWPCDFTMDVPGSPRFVNDASNWALPSHLLAQHGYLPAAMAPAVNSPWGPSPPQVHGYRRDSGVVGNGVTF
ncbi:hypothetical protein GQ602_001962 [Ophiocordyceps camponoti-floridani]|uniref:Uncharacterized protein n=1 Tax=Ophiocordyceps camponoti-floridani TaxID=2030778 RepID=A0A8H4Q9G2_9HYPO|nr:hypothetical protein GQ602_001962 [Ophiocordyceps camponoti-floridani]